MSDSGRWNSFRSSAQTCVFFKLIKYFSLNVSPQRENILELVLTLPSHTFALELLQLDQNSHTHLSQPQLRVQNPEKLVICIPSCPPRDKQLFHSIYLTEDCLDTHSAPGDELGSSVLTVISTMDSLFSNKSSQ